MCHLLFLPQCQKTYLRTCAPSNDSDQPAQLHFWLANKKEDNDQASIQLPYTIHPIHQRERRTHLKQRHHNQNTTSTKPKVQFLSQKLIGQTAIQNKNFTRTYKQRHTMTELVNHNRSTALERSVNILLRGGGVWVVVLIKSLNKTETPIFLSVVCSLFPKAIFLTFIKPILRGHNPRP